MNPFLSTVHCHEWCGKGVRNSFIINCVQIVLNGVASVFSGGGNQSVLSPNVSGNLRHRGEEGDEWSVSVVMENEVGNSSEVVVVLQGEVEWWVCSTVQCVQCVH